MALFDMLRNALMAGFGVQEKVREFIDELVKKGELSESQGAKLIKEWSEKAEKNTEEISKSLSEVMEKTLSKMNLPLRSICFQNQFALFGANSALKRHVPLYMGRTRPAKRDEPLPVPAGCR